MRIRFMGLITHFHDAGIGRHSAVMMTEAKHTPMMVLEERDIDGKPETSIAVVCHKLSGKVISFTTQAPTPAVVSRAGLIGVPSLTKIGGGGGTLHPDLRPQTTGTKFDAFVNLPFGAYGIEDWFLEHGTFSVVGTQCVPRTVVLDMRTITTITVNGLGSALTLKPHAVITITNLEDTLPGTGQFGVYGNLFDPAVAGITVAASVATCAHGTNMPDLLKCPQQLEQTFGVECSNSQYP